MIKKIKHEPDPKNHVERLVFQDHFGFEHHVTVYPFTAHQDASGKVTISKLDLQAELAKVIALLEAREQAYFEHLSGHHPEHAMVKSFRPAKDGSQK